MARDPDVRLEIGDRVYEQRLRPIDPAGDPQQHEAVYRAYAAKYGWGPAPASERPPVQYYEVVERT